MQSNSDIEAQRFYEVFIADKQLSRAYTGALEQPSILETAPDFIVNRAHYNIARTLLDTRHGTVIFPVLLITRELDRARLV